MKRAGKFVLAVLASAMLALTFALAGCSGGTSVVSIEKTGERGQDTVYTITYSDGSTSELVVQNGTDGSDVSASDLWQTYIEQTGEEISYEDFLQKYLVLESGDNSAVIGETLLSSLKVYAEFIEQTRIGFQIIENTSVYTGGGVIYSMNDEDTYILTNYHVVYNKNAAAGNVSANGENIARKIVCNLYGSESIPENSNSRDEYGYTVVDYGDYAIECDYVGGSAVSDIAVLRADTEDVLNINEQAQAVTVAQGYSVGDTAYTIGNPENDGISVTQGIVSIADDTIELNIDGVTRQYRSIRIDTPLYSGNSGGGLFNTEGEMIGIANAGNTQEENINYAIPVSIVTGTADNILYFYGDGDDTTNGVYKIAFTQQGGIVSKNAKYVYDSASGMGRIIEDVTLSAPTGIAKELGLQTGDIVRALIVARGNETFFYEVERTFDISDILYTLRPGDTLAVRYDRGTAKDMQTQALSLNADDFLAVA